MKYIHARRVLLIHKRTIPCRVFGTESLPKIDKNDIAYHDHSYDQPERDKEPVQADASGPRVLGKDKDGGYCIADEHYSHKRVGYDLEEETSGRQQTIHDTLLHIESILTSV